MIGEKWINRVIGGDVLVSFGYLLKIGCVPACLLGYYIWKMRGMVGVGRVVRGWGRFYDMPVFS